MPFTPGLFCAALYFLLINFRLFFFWTLPSVPRLTGLFLVYVSLPQN